MKKFILALLTIVSMTIAGNVYEIQPNLGESVKQYSEPVMNFIQNPINEPEVLNGLVEYVIPDADKGFEPYVPSIELPDYEDVKDNVEYVRTRKQDKGSCTKEAEDMMAIRSLQHLGYEPVENGEETLIDIRSEYWNKDFSPHVDNGDIPSDSYKKFREVGYSIKSNEQFSSKNRLKGSFENWGKGLKEGIATIKAPYKEVEAGKGADNLFRALERYQGKKYVVRLSIQNLWTKDLSKRCDNYYFSETPYLKETGCVRNGGHSTNMYDELGIFMYDNVNEPGGAKPSIMIRTSTGSKDKRIVSIDYYRNINTSWEIAIPDIVKDSNVSSKFDALKTATIRYTETSSNVKLLEEYLKEKGYFDHEPNDYYGLWTVTSLQNYLRYKTGVWYTGKLFGSISRSTIK